MANKNAKHKIPVVLLGVLELDSIEPLATLLRQEGFDLVFAVGERGCLRVAAQADPDIIVLDPGLPPRLPRLLRTRRRARRAEVSWSLALSGGLRHGPGAPIRSTSE